ILTTMRKSIFHIYQYLVNFVDCFLLKFSFFLFTSRFFNLVISCSLLDNCFFNVSISLISSLFACCCSFRMFVMIFLIVPFFIYSFNILISLGYVKYIIILVLFYFKCGKKLTIFVKRLNLLNLMTARSHRGDFILNILFIASIYWSWASNIFVFIFHKWMNILVKIFLSFV